MRRVLQVAVFLAILTSLSTVPGTGRGLSAGGSPQNQAAPAAQAPAQVTQAGPALPSVDLKLPVQKDSVKFAVIGDFGTGEKEQYEVAAQMVKYHAAFPFDFVVLLGDNLYGGSSPADYDRKFERPYKPLLDGGVTFYASLGNHDNQNERFYKPFNMGGERYYGFKKGNIDFLALDSNYMDPNQLKWLEDKLKAAGSPWKICFFHHPLYSDGKYHGPDRDLRTRIEPLFQKYGVNVVLSGHEHVYERVKPQKGIYYFVLGNSGELRYKNLRASSDTVKGFDTDRTFMLVEIAGDSFYFQTISRTGATVDSDVLARQQQSKSAPISVVLPAPSARLGGNLAAGSPTPERALQPGSLPRRTTGATETVVGVRQQSSP